jgi:hypothetical protein
LGNQLFQVASTIGIATKKGCNFTFQEQWDEPYPGKPGRDTYSTPWTYQKYFKTPLPLSSTEVDVQYDEGPYTDYKEIDLPDAKTCNLHGYFQSYKYFEECEDLVRYYMTPHDGWLRYLLYKFPILLTDSFTSLHVRRTDYKTHNDIYCQLDEPPLVDYYHKAIKHLGAKNILVFSDDMDYVRETLPNPTGRIIYVNLENDILALFLMSLCHAHVIANSSYSWWGAWLNNDPHKRVVAPKHWYTEEHLAASYRDPSTALSNLIPPSWTLI